MGKNKILVRLENIADLLDSDNLAKDRQGYTVDIDEFAHALYKHANNDADPASVRIQEVSLSANQPIYNIDYN